MKMMMVICSLMMISTSAMAVQSFRFTEGEKCVDAALRVGNHNIASGVALHTLNDQAEAATAAGKTDVLEKLATEVQKSQEFLTQLNSSFAFHCVNPEGTIEMKTGEGKIVTATCAEAFVAVANNEISMGEYLGELDCAEKQAIKDDSPEQIKRISAEQLKIREQATATLGLIVNKCVLKDKVIGTEKAAPKNENTNTGNNG